MSSSVVFERSCHGVAKLPASLQLGSSRLFKMTRCITQNLLGTEAVGNPVSSMTSLPGQASESLDQASGANF